MLVEVQQIDQYLARKFFFLLDRLLVFLVFSFFFVLTRLFWLEAFPDTQESAEAIVESYREE